MIHLPALNLLRLLPALSYLATLLLSRAFLCVARSVGGAVALDGGVCYTYSTRQYNCPLVYVGEGKGVGDKDR